MPPWKPWRTPCATPRAYGFPHTYEEELSICFVDAVLYEEPSDDDSDDADEE